MSSPEVVRLVSRGIFGGGRGRMMGRWERLFGLRKWGGDGIC